MPAVNAPAEVPEREPGEGKGRPELKHGEAVGGALYDQALTCCRVSEQCEGKKHPKLKHGEAFRDALFFQARSGCRVSELLLRCQDVDLKAGTFRFVDTKNRLDHVPPMTARLREILTRRLAAAKGE